MSIDSLRRCVAEYGHRACSDRIYLAELLGYQKAAKQITAQIRLHGLPGPRREPTEAEVAEATAWLAELELKGESEPYPTPAELEESAAVAREALAECPFGSGKWTDEIWASIDARLGADWNSIAKTGASRKTAQTHWLIRSCFGGGESGKAAYKRYKDAYPHVPFIVEGAADLNVHDVYPDD